MVRHGFFSTIDSTDQSQSLDSPAFKPFYLKYEQWKEEHKLQQQPVKPYLTTLDSIVRKNPE
ncbi:hypothetical protein PV11_01897 [Exophiala sideris]|uniref:Uncharacterized protein n=1 Tax=Exophiala sideris TaxID=1016849 RepID=A0A0D1YXI3_9EURO|nr:hypothetical protein PV11_01897 [Exophiala sideris]